MSQAKDQTKTTAKDRAIAVAVAASMAVGVGLAHDAVLHNLEAAKPSQSQQ